ncbi:MAG: HAMP domain-containing histidine kinase [Thermoanaerobaculaceae bacterium]|nr:HAMP domain-containing histidine kinase [Thermoanaerobaculaceae bacterium]MDI9622706.1 HAMP domain-containing sensor histidine kinase [Acidobacteriota bacterium]NLH10027.1 HAMP domain-containing histidine kinase [Holophagae bacterium]
MAAMVTRTWASSWWAPTSGGGRCLVCSQAGERIGPAALERVRAFALELLTSGDPRTQALLTIEWLSTSCGADVLLLTPEHDDEWLVVAGSRPGTHDDVLLAGPRWPGLAAARTSGEPVLPGAQSTGDSPDTAVLVLPLLGPLPTGGPVVLLLELHQPPALETVSLAVLVAHLLVHRLAGCDPAAVATALGVGFAQSGSTCPAGLPARVAALEAANRRLEELARLRTRFVSDAAHELKTPLAILRSYLEALGTDLVGGLDREQRDFLAAATEGSRRLQRLVEELLDLAALESGNLPLQLVAVDAPSALRTVFEELRRLASLGEVDIRLGPLQAVTARADPTRLGQVLRNLLDNALKYTPRGGTVRLSCRRRGGAAVLEVTDTGIGIPTEELPRIFDEFYRVRHTPTREGAGLGLAIVRRLMQAMGGRIDVSSQNRAGSRFSIELPIWADEP